MALSGNKGEWSEIYVFLRLLDQGRLNVADDNLNAVPEEFYRILEIIRKETVTTNYYIREDDSVRIVIKNDCTGLEDSFSFPISLFAREANRLLTRMTNGKERKHPEIEAFLSSISVHSVKDVGHKRDITIKIEDFHSRAAHILGFSIKSFLGADATLFNAGSGTNFIYEVVFPESIGVDCDAFNAETYSEKKRISARLNRITGVLGGSLRFDSIQSNCLYQNLRTIDGDLPDLLAHLLVFRYTSSKSSSVLDCTNELTSANPLGFNIVNHGQVYEYKVKRFLQDCALGMTPEKPWMGVYDATGGQIVVKEDGEIVCYHIYELNRFMDYLFNSTKFESPSTGEDKAHPGHPRQDADKKYYYGWLYKEGEKYYIKLNIQVRFK